MAIGAFLEILGLTALAAGVGTWISQRSMRKQGRAVTPQMRRWLWIGIPATILAASFMGWAITNGHPGIGIAAMVAFFVLPSFVTIPLSIRRSKARAETARHARESKRA